MRSEPGLEVLAWTMRADGVEIARALSGLNTSGSGVREAHATMWKANGVRVVVVPKGKVAEVRAGLSSVLNTDRQWLGQAYAWTPIVYGQGLGAGSVVKTDADEIKVSEGRMRLLARCWVMPRAAEIGEGKSGSSGSASAAALRMEFAIQYEDGKGRSGDVLDEGLVFRRLAAGIDAAGDAAYLLISERPEVDWEEAAKGKRVPDESEAMREEMKAATSDQSKAGPPRPWDAGLVGEALLRGNVVGGRPVRSVVMLVPTVPERFELLPREAGAGSEARR